MKIIDLLNKIANGEELPKSFVYNYTLYNLNDGKYKDDENFSLLDSIRYDFKNLNDEIKIIEENKKIEKINDYIPIGLTSMGADFRKEDVFEALMRIGDKINEIIKHINKGD